jgi:hypothetical protein
MKVKQPPVEKVTPDSPSFSGRAELPLCPLFPSSAPADDEKPFQMHLGALPPKWSAGLQPALDVRAVRTVAITRSLAQRTIGYKPVRDQRSEGNVRHAPPCSVPLKIRG